MDFFTLYLYTIIWLLGICVGSFLNVVIYRIPKGESVVGGRSYCPSCKKKLKWYELFPIFSYVFLKGKCKDCKSQISLWYPLTEAINGFMWVLIFLNFGMTYTTVLGWLFASALLSLSIIDAKTREIPFSINIFIGIVGIINLALNFTNWHDYLLGAVSVSAFLLLLLLLSGGRAIGGGDVKLMFFAGLFLGLIPTVLAFFIACIVASIIHLIKMKFFGAKRDLALGPYLSIGLIISFLYGSQIVDFYLSMLLI